MITNHLIPRQISSSSSDVLTRELHVFSDASTVALGGVLYCQTIHQDMSITVDLISSRAKIAPQQKQTIPRLELNGAVILSKLLISVSHDLSIPLKSVYAWTDSSIVLGQLQATQSRLGAYVAHRVKFINSLIPSSHWKHVDTKSNPADLLSRGVMSSALINLDLWCSSPPWLRLSSDHWPQQKFVHCTQNLPDLKPTVLTIQHPIYEFGLKFSSFPRLVRIMGWVQRFIFRTKIKRSFSFDHLTLIEHRRAKCILTKLSQQHAYHDAIVKLQKDKTLPCHNPLASLAPYLDNQGLLRVGGRMQQSNLPKDSVHPIILSLKSHFTVLMVIFALRFSLHVGTATVMATLSASYYIPGVRGLLK